MVENHPSGIAAFFRKLYPMSIVYAKDTSVVFVM